MRERLGDHFGEYCIVRAEFQSYSKTPDDSNVVCFRSVYIEGRRVADHVWTHRSKAMKQAEMKTGDKVEFEARVGRYTRTIPRPHSEAIEFDFCLEKIREFRVTQRRLEGENGEHI